MRTYPFIYSQRDPAWATNRLGTITGATIGQYGCILTCHAMKAGYYGHEIKPDALNDIYTQRELYISGDLLSDADINAVFSDISLTDTHDYANSPADLNLLKQLASDPAITVTIELDFDHDPNDGIQTHFVELHEYDGTTLTIYDPWYGTDDNFTLHYGNNLAQTILKFAVYKGSPTKPPVEVDATTFEKLVMNSSSYDAVCDELLLPHNSSSDAVIAAIRKIKTDKASAQADAAAKQSTVTNLNEQIIQLKAQVGTLTNEVTDLTTKLDAATGQANSNGDAGKLLAQCEINLKDTRQTLTDTTASYNKSIAQYKGTSYKEVSSGILWNELWQRILHIKN